MALMISASEISPADRASQNLPSGSRWLRRCLSLRFLIRLLSRRRPGSA
jgi:hypothetical protein